MPKRLVVLGGGVIGCEFASIFAHFGSEVTIVEMLDHLIPTEDADADQRAREGLQEAQDHARARRARDAHRGGRRRRAPRATPRVTRSTAVEADYLLVATGRGANVEDIGLDAAGVQAERTRIPVDAHMRTNVPHIYATGDVAGNWQLAHTAFREGEVAAENALGHDAEIDYRSTPRCIYTDPEVAAVGLTEAQARERYGDDVAVGTMPYSAIARAAMYGDRTGFVKAIYETKYGEFLGLVAVGTQATELVNVGVVGDRGRVDDRDRRRLDHRAPDARRGGQGGGAGGDRPAAPHARAAQAGEGGRDGVGVSIALQRSQVARRGVCWQASTLHASALL